MSFALTPARIANESWQVPAFEECHLRGRCTRYCIVIPVINEGERLLDQLRQMSEQGIMGLADVILADGSSSDGTTEPGRLAALGLAALLVKRGPGKLSAQLRMAYAWALEAGYEGIVTIDGNGKDGVESLPDFLAALDRGVDYAQASRFLPGGEGVNTPLIRLVAIRLLHSPALSLAARKWLTDTTQGYRAYSQRYLMHPKVQPFRDIFVRYELLAYLTVRASRLGLTVTELPTRRVYPDDGAIPTKISAVSGNFDLLRTLWAAVTGRYNPPRCAEVCESGALGHGSR